ncbi:MAG: LysM peptidoglycan-binding domain-containing protein [Candidatus Cloacimonetes bacterium]|nr:LysM peptidoglycan-binding domain-containing protein [Candidatus Cloacimonadota bacterium]
MKTYLVILITTLVLYGCGSWANTNLNTVVVGITLNDGQSIKGRIVGKKENSVFIELNNSKNLFFINRNQINSIYSLKGIQNNLSLLFYNDDWMMSKYNEFDFNTLITEIDTQNIQEYIAITQPQLEEFEISLYPDEKDSMYNPKDSQKEIYLKEHFEPYLEKSQYLNTWTVSKGESLWKIAGYLEIYGDPTKWELIWRENLEIINDPSLIYPNQLLIIPRFDNY